MRFLGCSLLLFASTNGQSVSNVALKKPVLADSEYTNSKEGSCGPGGTRAVCSADRAVDGKADAFGDRWVSSNETPNHYLAIDLEAEHVISQIEIKFTTWDDPESQSTAIQESYGSCRHAISVWTGDSSVSFKDAVASRHGWKTVVRNDKFSVYSNHDSEAFDFSVFSTQYLKFDFDNSRCPASVKRTKKGFLNLVRVAEIEVLGFPQSTSTTATSTTGTATSTTNTDVAALHSRIDDLLSNQVNGDNVNGKVQAIEELIKGMQAQQTLHDTIIKSMQGTIAGLQNDKGALTARVGELETAQRDLTTTLDLFMAAPNRPNLAEGGCDSGGDCRAPEITAGADSSGLNPGGLKLSAPDGSVVVESSGCGQIDICDLSLDVQSVLDKFNV